MATALVLSSIFMVFVGLWLTHLLMKPMAHAIDAANRLAQGNLTGHIQPSGNEETLQLLQSLVQIQNQMTSMVREVKDNACCVATASTL